MRSVILCEGFDDAYILGYYLNKTLRWERKPKLKFSKNYHLLATVNHRVKIEYYALNNDYLAIWSVGGRDSYHLAFKDIKKINNEHASEGINKLFILSDRDDFTIEEQLNNFKQSLNSEGLQIENFTNNEASVYEYTVEEETYTLEIIPIIIPFEQTGAIETILMEAIASEEAEEAFIVESAIAYVDNILASERLTKYLTHARTRLKAKYSSVISITNPDRSTSTFDTLLTTHNWEEKESIQRHFAAFETFL